MASSGTYCGTSAGTFIFGAADGDGAYVYSIDIQAAAGGGTTVTLKNGASDGTLKFSMIVAANGTYHANFPKGLFFSRTPYLAQAGTAGTVTITYEQV